MKYRGPGFHGWEGALEGTRYDAHQQDAKSDVGPTTRRDPNTTHSFGRPPRPEFGSGYRIVGGRWPVLRVRGSHGSWMAEDDESARAGSGRTPEEAVGDWFLRNAEHMGFDVRRYG